MAWDDDKTHRDLSEKAGEHSVLAASKGDYLKNNLDFNSNLFEVFKFDGKQKNVKEWLRYGGLMEDESVKFLGIKIKFIGRFYNHFHNPLESWDQAGLDSIVNGMSALLWAQDDVKNDEWAWQKVREYYRLALTSQAEAERSGNFAKTFRGLGQLAHLIEDMAQPAHVRNDAHPEDNEGIRPGFEWWAKQPENDSLMKSLMSEPIFPDVPLNVTKNGKMPISQFWDTDQYTETSGAFTGTSIGIAEYTNANFFSEDTIFDSDFPYPSKEQTNAKQIEVLAEDGQVDLPWYVMRAGTEDIIAVYSYLKKYLDDISGYDLYDVEGEWKYLLDDKVYADCAKHLIPRAVGYSAALINYFFRGQMETTALEKIDSDGNVTELQVNIQNTTPNETMKDGYFTLTCRYKRQWLDQYIYGTSADLTSGELAPDASPVAFTFTFADPIPADATEKQYILVFHDGTLGVETGAVVGKVVPVTPAQIDITHPERFVYAIVDDGVASFPKEFKKLRAKLRDNAPEIEMTGGSVTAKAKYKLHLSHRDDLSTEPPYAEDRFHDFYSSTSLPVEVSLDNLNPTEIEFDFSANPIPFGITDLSLEVVYEQGDTLIAYGTKDLNEPQYIGVWNSHDRFLIDLDTNRDDDIHDWRLMTESEIMNDPTLMDMLDTDGGGYVDEIIDAVAVNFDVYFSATPPSALPETYHATFSSIPAGRYGRVAIMTDQPYLFALFHEKYTSSLPDSDAPGDYLDHEGQMVYITPGVTNQSKEGTYYYTPIYSFRGVPNHFTYFSAGIYPQPSSLAETVIVTKEANWPAPVDTAPVPAATINP